jgi:hypothetical protein
MECAHICNSGGSYFIEVRTRTSDLVITKTVLQLEDGII